MTFPKIMVGLNVVLAGLLAVVAVIFINERQNPDPVVVAEAPSQQEFESQVRDYLLTNPEVVREALLELENREIAAQEAQQQMIIAQNANSIFKSEYDFVVGNPDGDITLVEYFDYNCGFCKRALEDLERLLAEDPDLRVVLKEFPVLGPGSIEAAKISAAATDEENFFEFHTQLLRNPGNVDGAAALAAAATAGMDASAIATEAEARDVVNNIGETLQVARQIGINGTPSYIIGGKLIVGAVGYDELKQHIADERARQSTLTN